jgi:hypothetical protein
VLQGQGWVDASEAKRLMGIEQAAREMVSFLLSRSGDFWPGPQMRPDLPTALLGLAVQLDKLDEALREKPTT